MSHFYLPEPPQDVEKREVFFNGPVHLYWSPDVTTQLFNTWRPGCWKHVRRFVRICGHSHVASAGEVSSRQLEASPLVGRTSHRGGVTSPLGVVGARDLSTTRDTYAVICHCNPHLL